MAPFDAPGARRGADRDREDQREGRRRRPQDRAQDLRHAERRPDGVQGVRRQADQRGAKIIFTTCDVDLATPVVQESINHGLLTIAPCIGTDQMGPKRFGSKGKLAFSFGNVAQDEGSAMAQFAWKHGWKTADLAKDNAIVYFQAVVSAFKARFMQLGGKINYETTYADAEYGGNERRERRHRDQPPQEAGRHRHVHGGRVRVAWLVHHRAADGGEQDADPQLVGRRRDVLGRRPNPKVTNYWFVTYANAFGHDPNRGREQAREGRSRPGPAASSPGRPRSTARHGDQAGARLARRLEARGGDAEVPQRPDALGQGQLLEEAALGLRPPIPRDRDQQQRRRSRRA